MFRARLSLWISLLLFSPAWAKPTLEQLQGFIARLEVRQQAGDLRGILRQAAEEPELAAIVVHDWPLETPDLPGRRRQLFTLVVRGLELKGTLPSESVKALLSPQEAVLTLEAAPAVEVGPRLEAIDWFYWGIPNANRLLDVGNYRQLATVFDAYVETLGGKPEARLYPALARMLAGDFPYSAARRRQMVAWAGENAENLSFLYASMGMAALDFGRADVAAEVLEPLERSLRDTRPERQPFYHFLLETLRYRLAARERVEKDLSELRASHDRAWEAFAAYKNGSSSDMRLWMRCAQYWAGILNSEVNFGKDEFKALQQADLKQLFRVSQEALEQGSYGAQLGTLNGLLELELDNLWLETRTLEQSRPVLELAATTLQTYRGWMEEDQQRQDETCPPGLRRRLGGDFRLDFAHGDLDLLESRYLALRQLHAPSPETLRALNEASDRSTRYHGLVGFRDARFALILNGQVALADRQRLLEGLQKDWERCQFRPGLLSLAMDRGRLLAESGRKAEAVAQLQQATGPLEGYLAELGAGALTLEAHRRNYLLLARLQAELGRPEESFATLTRFQNLEAVQRSARALWQRPEVARVRLLSEEGQALEQQASLQRSLGLAADSQLLADNRQRFEQALEQLLQREPRYRRALRVLPADLAGARRSLPADAALVQYVPGPEGLYVLVVTRQGVKARRIAVSQAELDKRVARLRTRIAGFASRPDLIKGFRWSDPKAPGYDNHTRPLLEDSRRLYDWLLRPLEADLKGRSVLAIVPSGNLYYLPFSGLIRSMGPKGPEFVAQRWQCVELVKAADLRELQKTVPTAQGLLALANPDGSLPGAEREVRVISRFFPKAGLHFGSDAAAPLLRALPKGTGYLHLATHGILNARDPLASYLVVAGSRLHIRDVYGLSFRDLRLVTLSACQTAIQEGDVTGGEVTSLAQAFSVAGGRAVLASLWDVSDDGTERLMSALYPKLARGMSLSKALQQAQLEVMAQAKFQHPFYWAAFSLYGDWR